MADFGVCKPDYKLAYLNTQPSSNITYFSKVQVLTIHQVNELFAEGVGIKFRRKAHPFGDKGNYDPSQLRIEVYTPNLESRIDRDITILHEFIHARDEIKGTHYYHRRNHRSVEKEAIDTYKKRPEVLEYIKELYAIR